MEGLLLYMSQGNQAYPILVHYSREYVPNGVCLKEKIDWWRSSLLVLWWIVVFIFGWPVLVEITIIVLVDLFVIGRNMLLFLFIIWNIFLFLLLLLFFLAGVVVVIVDIHLIVSIELQLRKWIIFWYMSFIVFLLCLLIIFWNIILLIFFCLKMWNFS